MTTAQTRLQSERAGTYFVAELKAHPTQELRHFMEGSWTASILSPAQIEELYQELHHREASPPVGTEEDFIEMGQDSDFHVGRGERVVIKAKSGSSAT
jgi:hypothetical protein